MMAAITSIFFVHTYIQLPWPWMEAYRPQNGTFIIPMKWPRCDAVTLHYSFSLGVYSTAAVFGEQVKVSTCAIASSNPVLRYRQLYPHTQRQSGGVLFTLPLMITLSIGTAKRTVECITYRCRNIVHCLILQMEISQKCNMLQVAISHAHAHELWHTLSNILAITVWECVSQNNNSCRYLWL